MTDGFELAVEFARNPRTARRLAIDGDEFELIVPRDGRLGGLVLYEGLDGILEFFEACMDGEEYQDFEDYVLDRDEGLEMDELKQVYRHAIQLMSGGEPYWVVQALAATAAADYKRIGGELLRVGVDLAEMPLHELVAAVYSWLTDGADSESRKDFDAKLYKPPAGVADEFVAALPEFANAGNDFLAQMAMRGGGRTGGSAPVVTSPEGTGAPVSGE